MLLSTSARNLACEFRDTKILVSLSFVMMLVVLAIGTKIMLLMPKVAKSGMWLHVKLSFDIIAMAINTYFLFLAIKNKKLSQKSSVLFYWGIVVMFLIMLLLTLFKPF
jgi:putative membrane protein